MSSLDMDAWLQDKLEQRKAEGAFRALSTSEGKVDFCSNDYLGFARSPELHQSTLQEISSLPSAKTGSTGSRLITGNSPYLENLETTLAHFHKAPTGLLFNSGYDLNLGLFSALPQRSDTVLYDQLVHASIRDGLRLGLARHYSFKHNDLDHLREKITQAQGKIFIAVESVYSMDGDFAPLTDLVEICQEFNAALIVDEAHATGIFGEMGRGKIVEMGLEEKIFARVHTFGKAMGTHGAIVFGSPLLRDYLINYARPLIYSTALPLHSLISIQCAYEHLQQSHDEIQALHQLIQTFKSKIAEFSGMSFLESESPIQGIIIPGNLQVKTIAQNLQNQNLDVRPILSPTVPQGKERLRICLHTHNSKEEVVRLIESIKEMIQ